jgi:hypothetical protein
MHSCSSSVLVDETGEQVTPLPRKHAAAGSLVQLSEQRSGEASQRPPCLCLAGLGCWVGPDVGDPVAGVQGRIAVRAQYSDIGPSLSAELRRNALCLLGVDGACDLDNVLSRA